jgi:hypothetical protein
MRITKRAGMGRALSSEGGSARAPEGAPVPVASVKMGARARVLIAKPLRLLTGRMGMADRLLVSRKDGSGEAPRRTGAEAVSGTATVQKIDPASLGTAFLRTHQVLWLEFGDLKDFDDPRREWRRLFSELLGTFALVLVAAGGGVLHSRGQISLAAAVVAPGLMVMAVILFMGAVSGAHLNPAVSLAFALRGDFPWRRVPGYIVI